MTPLEKSTFVMDYLECLGLGYWTIGTAIEDGNLEKSYQLIKNNPTITKAEFLTIMEIEEEEY